MGETPPASPHQRPTNPTSATPAQLATQQPGYGEPWPWMAERLPPSIRHCFAVRYNCWVEFTTDVDAAVEMTREKLRAEVRQQYPDADSGVVDRIAPIKIEIARASWNYPDRVVVTW